MTKLTGKTKQRQAAAGVKFGCYCDLEEGMTPDGCVIDEGDRGSCTFASKHRSKWSCPEWQVVVAPQSKSTIADLKAKIEALEAENKSLRGMIPTPPVDETLDARMKAAGMIPLSEILAGKTPLEAFRAHTGVRDAATFEQWLAMRAGSIMTMRVQYELGDRDKADGLFEWVFARSAAFDEVMTNWRKATSNA